MWSKYSRNVRLEMRIFVLLLHLSNPNFPCRPEFRLLPIHVSKANRRKENVPEEFFRIHSLEQLKKDILKQEAVAFHSLIRRLLWLSIIIIISSSPTHAALFQFFEEILSVFGPRIWSKQFVSYSRLVGFLVLVRQHCGGLIYYE